MSQKWELKLGSHHNSDLNCENACFSPTQQHLSSMWKTEKHLNQDPTDFILVLELLSWVVWQKTCAVLLSFLHLKCFQMIRASRRCRSSKREMGWVFWLCSKKLTGWNNAPTPVPDSAQWIYHIRKIFRGASLYLHNSCARIYRNSFQTLFCLLEFTWSSIMFLIHHVSQTAL